MHLIKLLYNRKVPNLSGFYTVCETQDKTVPNTYQRGRISLFYSLLAWYLPGGRHYPLSQASPGPIGIRLWRTSLLQRRTGLTQCNGRHLPGAFHLNRRGNFVSGARHYSRAQPGAAPLGSLCDKCLTPTFSQSTSH